MVNTDLPQSLFAGVLAHDGKGQRIGLVQFQVQHVLHDGSLGDMRSAQMFHTGLTPGQPFVTILDKFGSG